MSDARQAGMKHPSRDWITRSLHWINAIAIGVLVVSGTAIGLAGEADEGAASFLPPAFLNAIGHTPHDALAFVFMLAGIIYVLSLVTSGRWRMFVPGTFTAGYSAAQRLAYAAAILIASGEALTGCALLFGRRLPWLSWALGGREVVTSMHIALTFSLLAFVFVHVVQVARAGMPTLRSMIEGRQSGSKWRTRAEVMGMAAFVAMFVAVVGFSGNAISGSLHNNRLPQVTPFVGATDDSPAGEGHVERENDD